MAEKTYLTSLEKVCKGAQRGGLSLEQNEVSGGRVTEQKYTIRTLKINPPARHFFFSFDAENKNNIIAVSSTAKYQETKKSDQNKKVFYAAALTSALFERKGGGSKLLLSN